MLCADLSSAFSWQSCFLLSTLPRWYTACIEGGLCASLVAEATVSIYRLYFGGRQVEIGSSRSIT